MNNIDNILGVIGVFGSSAYIAYAILEAFRVRQHARLTSEFNNKLLDRVASAQELGLLLNSEGGGRLLASLAGSRNGGPHSRILRAVQAGFVLLSLGIGLFMIAWWNSTLPLEGHDALNIFGAIATSLGIGLLLSAGASYALSKHMGLINGESDRRSANPVHSA